MKPILQQRPCPAFSFEVLDSWPGCSLLAPNMTIVITGGIRCSRMVGSHILNLEPSLHLRLCKLRSTLVALVGVLVEDCAVMLARVFAAFDHKQYQVEKLGVSVVGVVDMCW